MEEERNFHGSSSMCSNWCEIWNIKLFSWLLSSKSTQDDEKGTRASSIIDHF